MTESVESSTGAPSEIIARGTPSPHGVNGQVSALMSYPGGAEALEILAATPVQVIISDQLMPGMTGVQLLGRVRRMYPATVRIILSGYAELGTITEAINHGAVWKYLMKPWSGELLRQLVAEAFRHAEEGD